MSATESKIIESLARYLANKECYDAIDNGWNPDKPEDVEHFMPLARISSKRLCANLLPVIDTEVARAEREGYQRGQAEMTGVINQKTKDLIDTLKDLCDYPEEAYDSQGNKYLAVSVDSLRHVIETVVDS